MCISIYRYSVACQENIENQISFFVTFCCVVLVRKLYLNRADSTRQCNTFWWPILSDYCRSAPEHNVVVIPEREIKPDWKTGDRNISGTRNRNRCCNGTKLELAPSGLSSESPLKLNGWLLTRNSLLLYSYEGLDLVSPALLMSSRSVSCSFSTQVPDRATQRRSVWVRFRLWQLNRQCEGQQGELGQLEQRQQHWGGQRPQRPNTHLHYLIQKK